MAPAQGWHANSWSVPNFQFIHSDDFLNQKKVYGTGSSQAVPHPSTIPARRCLTSVIGRERVFSSWYGRRHSHQEIFLFICQILYGCLEEVSPTFAFSYHCSTTSALHLSPQAKPICIVNWSLSFASHIPIVFTSVTRILKLERYRED